MLEKLNAKLNTKLSANELKTSPIFRVFLHYFLPSLFAMLAMSTYSSVDGIFVGQKLGDSALAAIGIAWPIFPAFIAYELLFSVGGAAMAGYFLGRKKPHHARVVFSSVVYFALLSAILGGVLCAIFAQDLAILLGANDELKDLVVQYIKISFFGAFVIILHPLLDIFVITDKRPILASIAMILGSLLNIIFNYIFLFIFELGIAASALATIIGHGTGATILLWHFLAKKGEIYFVAKFDLKSLFYAAKNGIPQASTEISAAIVMIIFVHLIVQISSSHGMAIYGVLLYIWVLPFSVLIASAQGVLPLASFNFGAGLKERVRQIFFFGLIFTSGVGFASYGLLAIFCEDIAGIFLSNEILSQNPNFKSEIAYFGRILFSCFGFMGACIAASVGLQAIQRTFSSLIITISYELLFVLIFAYFLPPKFGLAGVMASYPLGCVCACFIAFLVVLYEIKKGALKI